MKIFWGGGCSKHFQTLKPLFFFFKTSQFKENNSLEDIFTDKKNKLLYSHRINKLHPENED